MLNPNTGLENERLISNGRSHFRQKKLRIVAGAQQTCRPVTGEQHQVGDRAPLPNISVRPASENRAIGRPSQVCAGELDHAGTLGLMMVSRFRYRSFKDLALRRRKSYLQVLPLAALLVAVAFQPQWTLLSFAVVYLASAPASYLWGAARRRLVAARKDSRSEVADEPAFR